MSQSYDAERIARERAICEAATPGPWEVEWENEYEESGGESWIYASHITPIIDYLDLSESGKDEDLIFCAAARTGWPDALSEISRLQEVMRDILRSSLHESGDDRYEWAMETERRLEAALRGE